MTNEIWKDIPGFESKWAISNLGEVYSKYKNKLKNKLKDEDGYEIIYTNTNPRKLRIHILVAKLFVPNPLNKPIVHHIDGNKLNNKASNLMWVTSREHSKLHGFKSNPVACYKDGKLIKVYPSPSAARKDGFSASSVQRVCQGKQPLCKKHFFKYITEEEFDKYQN
jgi:hypothetical protein